MQVQARGVSPQNEIPDDQPELQAPTTDIGKDCKVTRAGTKVKLPSYLNDYELYI